jgi:hypothetical protein
MKQFATLRERMRRGHIYWGDKGERLESDLEHIYGTLVITLGLESEYDFALNFNEIIETMLIHEADEIILDDPTDFDYTPEQRKVLTDDAVLRVFGNVKNGKHYMHLLDGFERKEDINNQYKHLIDKIEYTMQVKMNQLRARYDFANRPKNAATESDIVKKIIENGASDTFEVQYEYDKHRYHDFPCLRRILELTKNL